MRRLDFCVFFFLFCTLPLPSEKIGNLAFDYCMNSYAFILIPTHTDSYRLIPTHTLLIPLHSWEKAWGSHWTAGAQESALCGVSIVLSFALQGAVGEDCSDQLGASFPQANSAKTILGRGQPAPLIIQCLSHSIASQNQHAKDALAHVTRNAISMWWACHTIEKSYPPIHSIGQPWPTTEPLNIPPGIGLAGSKNASDFFQHLLGI